MQDRRLAQLQEEVQRIPGVASARVVGDRVPTEIHIVSSGRRAAKQLVRDVQSLAAAGFEMPIDHRIVSVVQLEEQAAAERRPGSTPVVRRPVLERVVQANKAGEGWVKVALQWPDGTLTEGVGQSGPSRAARARGAIVALLQALRPGLDALGAHVEVEHISLQPLGGSDTVLVRASFYAAGATVPVAGVALVHDDAAGAAVRALLHAVNRKLQPS